MDFAKELVPGESGVKEYSGCGFSGLVAIELECAEDKGSGGGSSLVLFFCLERKWWRFSFSPVEGTRVDVEAFADEYNELPVDPGSARLVVDWFANPVRRSGLRLFLPGEGIAGGTLLSFSLDRPILFGLEKSFIFELFDLDSFSAGGRGGGGIDCDAGIPGEGSGLLPLGNATLAAVVATSLLPPSDPFEYDRPPADAICGLCVSLGILRPRGGCEVLIGERPGCDRLRSLLMDDGGGEIWCIAACAAI